MSSYSNSIFNPLLLLLLLLLLFLNTLVLAIQQNEQGQSIGSLGVIKVNYKFSGSDRTLSALRAHDVDRHLAILSGVDLPLGGTGRPDSVGLYYARIGIGTPSKDYYVQVDTGTDMTWVNCIQCHECPRKGYHGIDLTLYDVNESLTGKRVPCNQEFCKAVTGGKTCRANETCLYMENYGDGSQSIGYFVEDVVQYDRVSGDLETKSANGTVVFGCGARQSGDIGSSDDALDGILGFGKSNLSMLSQIASSGRVKKMFAHCLDGVNGGGIFAIGHVVQPQVNTTPLVSNQPHYNVNMTAVQVGHDLLNLTLDGYVVGGNFGAIIDSGTTLAYLPDVIYKQLVKKIFSWQLDLRLKILHDIYTCFDYSDSVDDAFPPVTFHFENSLTLTVYPHEYLFPFEGLMCIGWQNSGVQSPDKRNSTLLGDLVLSNKLVLYDLENQTIGWTEYNCSSSIELKDEITGSVHLVGAHSLSNGCTVNIGAAFVSLLVAVLHVCLLLSSL